MVCVDGFVLTHAFEEVDVPSQADADAFLPRYQPAQRLDPAAPVSIGALVGPEAFTEVRYLAHRKLVAAVERIAALSAELGERLGRRVGGLVRPYRTEAAEVVVVALGSANGTLAETVDDLRANGIAAGALDLCTFRPFPAAAVRAALAGARQVIVLDRNVAPGHGGVLAADVAAALAGLPITVHTAIAGLGGRPILRASLARLVGDALAGRLEEPTFLDLDRASLARQLRSVP
jgi:pyruvate ferredoxin oxidoreductase alpha subunit